MPFTINGFGTSVCGGRGDVGWGSYDGMEWFVAAMMPIIPIKCVHTFDWNGEQYRAIPIKWSTELVVRTFLNRWLWGFVLAAVILTVIAFVDRGGFNPILLGIAIMLVALAVGIWFTLHITDKRNKEIRIVLGAETVGNCDPAHFTNGLLKEIAGNPRVLYGTKTWAAAAELLHARGSYAKAMWAARMCVAIENPSEGEELTNQILSDHEVADAIELVRKKPNRWQELMLSDEDSQTPAAEPVEELEEVGDDRPPREERARRKRPRDDEDY